MASGSSRGRANSTLSVGGRAFRLHSGLCDSISEISVPPDDYYSQLDDLEERLTRTRERYESMIEELRASRDADRKEIATLRAEVAQLRNNADASLDQMYLWGTEAGKAAAVAAIDQIQNRFKVNKLSSGDSDASSTGTAATLSSTRSSMVPKCLRTASKKQLFK